MGTTRDLITKAMKKAKILTKSEQPDNDEFEDALSSFHDILGSWSTDELIVYSRAWEVFNLVGGTGEYTIGAGQDFNTSKPIKIIDAYVRSSTVDYPVKVINDKIYNSQISIKDITGIPDYLNFDNGYPTSIIRFYPVPSTSYELHLLSEKPLTEFGIDDEVVLPSGWSRALVYALAIDLASEYGQQVTQETYQIARESKGAIKTAVARNRSMDSKPQMVATDNIYSGYYR